MDTYYNPEDLAKFGTIGEKAPELAEKFFSYYNAVFEEGALTAREKSLIRTCCGTYGTVPILY